MPAPTIFDEDTYAWTHGAAIPAPSGGSVIDVESRAAIVLIIAVLKSAGLIQQD
jgi:hypothetical protein